MSKRNLVFLLFAFLFLSGQALAQGPTIFISTFNGRQILRIDGTTVTVIHTGIGSGIQSPEDIVVGPDGKIYICDSSTDRIWRMNQDGSEVEMIYDIAAATFPNDPSGPEGPSFLNDDLYFNTRGPSHTGVWKIPGVVTFPFGGVVGVLNPSIPDPVNLIDAGGTESDFGEGTAFDRLGNLLIVDRSNNTVLRSTPPFGPLTTSPLIATNLDTPFGIAVNSTGDIFVASGGTQTDITRFDSSGAFVVTFVNFSSSDSPFFLEFDASDNLYVVTAGAGGAGGKVWKVDTSGTPTPLVDLSVAFPTPPDLASNAAVGLAVPATEVSKTLEFTEFQKTNTYDFGSHKFKLSLDVNVGKVFKVKITAKDVRPKDLKSRLDPNVFPPGSDCVRFAGKGGKCVVYLAEGGDSQPLPDPTTEFDGPIDILIKYFESPVSPAVNPRMAHDRSDIAGDKFTEDMTTSFDPLPNPGDPGDPVLRGRTTNWSEFVAVDVPIDEEVIFVGFGPPLDSGEITIKAGRTLPVKFSLFSSTDGQLVPITDAVARISVEKVADGDGGVLVDFAEPTGGANEGNLFRFDPETGQYVFNFSTKGLTSDAEWKLTVTINKISSRSSPSVIFFTK